MMLHDVWAIKPRAFDALRNQMPAAIEVAAKLAGPTDDARRRGLPVLKSGNIATVRLSGPMMKEPGFLGEIFGFTSSRAVARAMDAAAVDDEVEAIILSIDSPGGTVDGTLELAEAVMAAGAAKPVIAQVDGIAASAAYWVAASAEKIYLTTAADEVGSIGVQLMLYDFHKAFENEGIEAVPIDTGQFKSAGAAGTEITEAQRAEFQRTVDQIFDMFTAHVAQWRSLPASQVERVSDGRTFLAQDAVDLGLADGIQPFSLTAQQFLRPTRSRKTSADYRARIRRRKLSALSNNLGA